MTVHDRQPAKQGQHYPYEPACRDEYQLIVLELCSPNITMTWSVLLPNIVKTPFKWVVPNSR